MALTDADLIARVLAGDDRNAFGELVRRYQSAVRGLLRKLTGADGALADDLAQETFLRAYRGLQGFRGETQLRAWLFRIAYHAFASDHRARKVVPSGEEPDLDVVAEDDAQPAENLMLRHDLGRAMAHLKPEERAALALTYGEDISH